MLFLTNLFDSFGWTRDDAKWIIGVAAAVIVGVATLSDSAAAALAIPAGALPYIRLGAFIVGIVSANYKTSGLPGRAWLLPLFLVIGLGGVSTGCAAPLKQKLIVGVQASESLLGVAQDTERSVYAAKTLPALTDARHTSFARAFSAAFQAEYDAASALETYQAGQPVPASVTSALTAANQLWTVVADVVPAAAQHTSDEQRILGTVKDWLQKLVDTFSNLNITLPPAIAAALR